MVFTFKALVVRIYTPFMPRINIYVSDQEKEELEVLKKRYPKISQSAFIMGRVLGRRERRKPVRMETADLVLLSELDTLISCILDDYRKKIDVISALKELQHKLRTKLGRV